MDDELIALLKEHPKTFTLTTFWGSRNQIWGSRPAWLDDPLLRETFNAIEIAKLENPKVAADAPERWLAGPIPRNIAKIRAAGVRIGIGGIRRHFRRRRLFRLQLAHGAGRTCESGPHSREAISVGTRNSAELLGLDDLGTVAPGKSADFIVLNANPLDNIGNTRRIARVYLRGKEVDRAALRAKWKMGRSTTTIRSRVPRVS